MLRKVLVLGLLILSTFFAFAASASSEEETDVEETGEEVGEEEDVSENFLPFRIEYGVIQSASVYDITSSESGDLFLNYEEGNEYTCEVIFDERYESVNVVVNGDVFLTVDSITIGQRYSYSFTFEEQPTEVVIDAYGELREQTENTEESSEQTEDSGITSEPEEEPAVDDSIIKDDSKIEEDSIIEEDLKLEESTLIEESFTNLIIPNAPPEPLSVPNEEVDDQEIQDGVYGELYKQIAALSNESIVLQDEIAELKLQVSELTDRLNQPVIEATQLADTQTSNEKQWLIGIGGCLFLVMASVLVIKARRRRK